MRKWVVIVVSLIIILAAVWYYFNRRPSPSLPAPEVPLRNDTMAGRRPSPPEDGTGL